jgi:hypothetical protein
VRERKIRKRRETSRRDEEGVDEVGGHRDRRGSWYPGGLSGRRTGAVPKLTRGKEMEAENGPWTIRRSQVKTACSDWCREEEERKKAAKYRSSARGDF